MNAFESRTLLAGLALALCATAATAQGNSATIYRDANFSGPAIAIDRANANLGLRYQIQSIRVAGGSWELCPQPNFRGNCLTITQSSRDLRRSHNWAGPLQSIRPVDDWNGGGGSNGGLQQSLRGMASEFFPAPRDGRGSGAARVLACNTGNNPSPGCAAQTADRFCRSHGWGGSARELMETVNRRTYLADVLCVRSGF